MLSEQDKCCLLYTSTGQPIYVGETYHHNGDLYRVESFDEGYPEPKVTLRRITDGTIFDVEAPALFLSLIHISRPPTSQAQKSLPLSVRMFSGTIRFSIWFGMF